MLLTIAITVALIFLALSGMPIFAVIAATSWSVFISLISK